MLVIQDYESNLKIIDQIVEKIDVAPVQVLIEAVIISVQLNKDKQLGVNFAVVDNLGRQLGTVGSGFSLNSNVGFNPAQVLTAAGKIATGAASGAAGAAAAVLDPNGFASDTNGIKYGFISNNVTGFVRAIETLGSTKMLASPRILVLNKQRAEIQLGSQLGFKSITTQNYVGTTQGVQFLNTGTLLRLRPFVSDDGMIRMEIHPERSTGTVDANTGLPSAQTAQLTTNVMVPNGTTLVIGGLMEDEDSYRSARITGPVPGPRSGTLLGLKDKLDQRRELVVLLTPHVWTDQQRAGQPGDVSDRRGNAPSPSEATASSASPAGFGLAASPGTEPSKPMATRTGWWDRERARFRDRRTRPASDPADFSAVAVSSGSARSASNLHESKSLQPSPAQAPREGVFRPAEDEQTQTTPLHAERSKQQNDPASSFELLPAPVPGNTDEIPLATADPVVMENRAQGKPRPRRRVDDGLILSSGLQPHPGEPRPRNPEGSAQSRQHVVLAGESFATIAKTIYGSEQHASLLWWANRNIVAWPEALKPGTTILVPPLQQIAEARLASSAPRASSAVNPTSISEEPPAPFPLAVPRAVEEGTRIPADPSLKPAGFEAAQDRPERSVIKNGLTQPNTGDQGSDSVKGGGYAIHVVRKGETLQRIARDRLGDERRRDEIAELNRDLLGGETPRLIPGQRLLLPGDAGPPRGQP